MDNKKTICNDLVPILQKTRDLKNLEALVYSIDEDNREWVTPIFKNARGKRINVTADSEIAMIRDVLNHF